MTRRRAGRGARLAALALLALAAAPSALPAQPLVPPSTAAAPEPALTLEVVGERLEAARHELQRRRGALREAPDGSPQQARLAEEVEALARLPPLLAEQRRTLQAGNGDEEAVAELQPADDIVFLSSLREAEARNRARIDSLEATLDASQKAVERATEVHDDADRGRRQARDRRATETDDPEAAAHALRLAEIRAREAEETLRLRELQRQAARTALDEQRARTAELERLIAQTEEVIAAHPEHDTDLSALAKRQGALERAAAAREQELATAELRLSQARARFQRSDSPPPALLEEVETRTLERDALATRARALHEAVDRTVLRQTLLERWEHTLDGRAAGNDLQTWRDQALALARDDRLALLQREGQLDDWRARAGELRARIESLPADDPRAPTLRRRLVVLGELQEATEDDIGRIQAERTLAEQLADAIGRQRGTISISDHLGRGLRAVADTWSYELFVVDDEGISIGEVVLAFLLLALGLALSRRVSRLVAGLLRRRARLDAGAAAAIETITFYALIVAFSLFALRAVSFPLTAFTILGGALAIGIGFGSQNVMNNFISGLILLLERPVRAGDLVEVEGTYGFVERIGARSTTIRATDNTHIVVPNSFFLESRVVNWTLSDDVIRAQVDVGVVYGSPTREVERILGEIMVEHPQVLSEPAPLVMFAGFGDNSLEFQAYFWTHARSPMALLRVTSAIRFSIDDRFREAGIVIAFPQRDVHLDAGAPLPVRLVERPGDEA